jgi:hypothetical protein
LGSTRNLIGTRAKLGYTVRILDGLIRVAASNRVVVADEGRDEGFISGQFRFVSPRRAKGRFHLDSYVGYRYEDYLNVPAFRLGGDNRLRGYEAGAFVGKNLVATNLEWRSDGIDILSAQVGLAAFYDLGAAADSFSKLVFHQGTGFGFRFLFPQVNRVVLRLDWGLPISGDRKVLPGTFFFTFGQAFPMPSSSGGNSPFVDL